MPLIGLSKKIIEKYFKLAVEDLYKNDLYLLESGHELHEQAISHRLAVYLEKYFKRLQYYKANELSVDCEYNKNGRNEKKVYQNCRDCSRENCFIKRYNSPVVAKVRNRNITFANAQEFVASYYNESRTQGKASRPDILVHKRGNNSPYNTLIIEIKKNSNQEENDKVIDKIKLSYFTCPYCEYKYQIGFYIEYNQNQAKIIKFEEGCEITIFQFNLSTLEWETNND